MLAWLGAFFCFVPLLTGVISRFTGNGYWFRDFEAVACAGETLANGGSLYSFELSCEGMNAMPFVYPAFVAYPFAWLYEALGRDAMYGAYIAIFVASALFLCWVLLFARQAPGNFWQRVVFFGLVTGSTIYWGNIALPLQALIAASLFAMPRRPWVFILAVMLAAAVKPIFLTYLLVLLTMPGSVVYRIAWGAAGALFAAGPAAWFMLTGGEDVQTQTELLRHYVFTVAPGDAYLGWFAMAGLPAGSLPVLAGYFVYAMLISIAAIAIAGAGQLRDSHRCWFGAGLGALLLPRFMPPDVFLVGLSATALILAAPAILGDRASLFRKLVLACGIAAVAGNIADASDYANEVSTFGLSLMTLWLGWVAITRHRQALIEDLSLA